ncbi:MAG: hypothetical protein VW995_16955 [Deltaproteobacteria bacterium]
MNTQSACRSSAFLTVDLERDGKQLGQSFRTTKSDVLRNGWDSLRVTNDWKSGEGQLLCSDCRGI